MNADPQVGRIAPQRPPFALSTLDSTVSGLRLLLRRTHAIGSELEPRVIFSHQHATTKPASSLADSMATPVQTPGKEAKAHG